MNFDSSGLSLELGIFVFVLFVLLCLSLIELYKRQIKIPSSNKSKKSYESADQSRFKRFVENINKTYFFYAHDAKGIFHYVSPSIVAILGYTPKEFMTHYTQYLTSNPLNDEAKRQTELNLSGQLEGSTYFIEIYHKNGSPYCLEVSEYPLHDSSGDVIGIEGIAHDITHQRKSEEDIRKLSHAIEQSPIAVVVTTADGNIEYANQKYLSLNESEFKDVDGKKPNVLKFGQMTDEQNKELWQTIITGREWRGDFENRLESGKTFWEHVIISPIKNDQGEITNFLVMEEDLTVQKEIEKKLVQQTNFDDITGLPNRVMALDRLSQAIKTAQRENHAVAVMAIDLDQFKYVNDTFGHATGDKLLMEAAKRLVKSVRTSDTVARIGGDEFLIILPVLEAVTQISVVAQKVLDAFTKPFFLENKEFHVTASIGVTTYPSDGETDDVLLRNADSAMYKAKEKARNTFCFYTSQMNEAANERMTMEYHLRHAIERNEFNVMFQPLIDIAQNKPVAVEALIRWHNHELGDVPPLKFIPLAEESGLIKEIGSWVLKQACQEAKIWKSVPEGDNLILAINVSSRQLKDEDFLNDVRKLIEDQELTAETLELEITERLLVEDAPESLKLLNEISKLGVCLSVDDFGTGYSSLGYLRKFPISTLKIDRMFVNDLTTDAEDAELTKAIIAMAHSLGLRVVAEGVETIEQLDFLRNEKCDVAQGYYFSRPLTAKGLREFLCQYK